MGAAESKADVSSEDKGPQGLSAAPAPTAAPPTAAPVEHKRRPSLIGRLGDGGQRAERRSAAAQRAPAPAARAAQRARPSTRTILRAPAPGPALSGRRRPSQAVGPLAQLMSREYHAGSFAPSREAPIVQPTALDSCCGCHVDICSASHEGRGCHARICCTDGNGRPRLWRVPACFGLLSACGNHSIDYRSATFIRRRMVLCTCGVCSDTHVEVPVGVEVRLPCLLGCFSDTDRREGPVGHGDFTRGAPVLFITGLSICGDASARYPGAPDSLDLDDNSQRMSEVYEG